MIDIEATQVDAIPLFAEIPTVDPDSLLDRFRQDWERDWENAKVP